uniref:Uncharacterized protein n=1 Tax=Calcidiscus leptoporus TaxID=127549 RepID=A0A7S0JIW1_9EUKA
MLLGSVASASAQEAYWPVCYGGGFVATRSAVTRVDRSVWARIVLSLRRGENIEEGHYMERTWAALLTLPLQPEEERALACASRSAGTNTELGALVRCRCSDIRSCAAGSTMPPH